MTNSADARIKHTRTALLSMGVLLTLIALSPALKAQDPKHPLDSLTSPEYWTTYEVLRASGKVDADTRYPMVQLKEPPKEEVLAWKPGQPIHREAFVVVWKGKQTFEAVVDLKGKKLVSWTEVKGVQPNIVREEENEITAAVMADAGLQAALKRRGITDLNSVFCFVSTPGYFGTPEEQGRRLFHVECGEQYGAREDAGPISGLTVVWDADAKKALRVIDTEIVPIVPVPGNFDKSSVGSLREVPSPITMQQPLGPGFRLDGQTVSWQKWSFHFRIDRRVGLILNNVGYQDGDRLRSILYEASLSEIFVPYMDPDEHWYAKTYFDGGELGDVFSGAMEPGECPENAVFFDQMYADWKLSAQIKQRAACLFEQPAGVMAWRHEGSGAIETRQARELVLRTIADAGTYDYIFDWIFRQDGTICVRVGASGEDKVKAVKSRTAADDPTGEASRYGRFIAESYVGVDHDHFFSFRLDFDVDGTSNSFVREKLQLQRLPATSLRKSVWVAKREIAKTEEQAKARMSMEQPENWLVINPDVKNYLGYPVGYALMGGENAMSLMVPEDYPQKRAGFTDYQIWATPYKENERYAAGDYPNHSKGGDGLPAWTKANRPIENTDIVLWYTMGFHHVPHSEDWPVMPAVWHEFEIKPINFFARNPALDLPD
jgi:primary-amine oxidase